MPYATPASRWPAWRTWFDRMLVAAWLTATLGFVLTLGRELVFQTNTSSWTSMWESAPLQVALNASRGRPIYNNWHEGPVHLAIYGPLYYKTLAVMGAAVHADHLKMIMVGRWLGVAFLMVGLVGVAWFIRHQGWPWWAAIIGISCVALLGPTAVRFVASARPDAMAAGLSVIGFAAVATRKPAGIVVGALLLSAAWLTKVTAVAAPVAAAFTLAAFPPSTAAKPFARWRPVAVFFAVFLLTNILAVAGLMLATDGWFYRHLHVASAAPISPRYAWFMLSRHRFESQIQFLFVFPALAVLTAVLVHFHQRAAGRAQAGGPSLCIAAVFFVFSVTVALATAMRQGSDRNYLIEPALAAGLLMGAWAGRMAGLRDRQDWLLTRAAATFALFSPMLLGLQDRLVACDYRARLLADATSVYQDDALAWARTLPQPLLCLDSWLAYRVGADNDLNDPIAYASHCLAGGLDPVSQRVRQKRYACIVTMAPAEGADYAIYADIPTLWPGLRDAILAAYTPQDGHGGWYAYIPKTDESQTRPSATRPKLSP